MSCANCGRLLPAEARFCLTCGTPQTPKAEARAEDDDESVSSLDSYDSAVCEISLWRGYVKAEFVAVVRDGAEVWEAARSPAFRCRGRVPAEDDPRAVRAYEKLLEVLAEDGWEPVRGGRPWYAFRFRRRVDDVTALPQALHGGRPAADRPSAHEPSL